MNRKQTLLICLSIIVIIGGIILNFREFVNDYWHVNIKNTIVTFIYISIWLLTIIAAIKKEYTIIIKSSIVFWVITLVLALLAIYFNVAGVNAGWVILLAILFLSQWTGLNYFIESYFNIYTIIASFSLSILTISIVSLRRYKYNHI
jgi:hypothetical protein